MNPPLVSFLIVGAGDRGPMYAGRAAAQPERARAVIVR